jgi:ribonuclease HI
MLVVDGSCVNNGTGAGKNPPAEEGKAPRGGLSFLYNGGNAGGHGTTMPYATAGNMNTMAGGAPLRGDVSIPIPDMTGKIAMPLEQKGPCGNILGPTSNRAKLRAVIAALDFRLWHDEG